MSLECIISRLSVKYWAVPISPERHKGWVRVGNISFQGIGSIGNCFATASRNYECWMQIYLCPPDGDLFPMSKTYHDSCVDREWVCQFQTYVPYFKRIIEFRWNAHNIGGKGAGGSNIGTSSSHNITCDCN